MISLILKNKLTGKPHKTMRPVHLRLSEDIIAHLKTTATEHGFDSIQGLIRLYIRQGLDKDNCSYNLCADLLFIEQLKRKGISQKIIDEALVDTNNICNNSEHPIS